MTTPKIADLKLDVTGLDRDGIIATLIITHGKSSKEAREYYALYHKGETGTSFVSIFDDFLLEANRTEKEVVDFLTDKGTANKLKTKSHFISRAKFASDLRIKLELEAEIAAEVAKKPVKTPAKK